MGLPKDPLQLSIGAAAAATAVTAKAIRHYERLKLIPKVPRRGTYRTYGPEHLEAIRLIRQVQRLGFTLMELRALGPEDCEPDWPRFLAAISGKRAALAAEMQRLADRDAALVHLERQLAPLVAAQLGNEAVCAALAPPRRAP
jgi:DNA-binding transcriptional MerR regulator